MKGFWANEWDLFLNDMKELGEFFLQPVEITGIPGKTNTQMLKPTVEEISQKASVPNQSFWSREWNAFMTDMENVGDFFLQPVEFTSTTKQEVKLDPMVNTEVRAEAASIGFWANEWNLFKDDLRNAKDFLTQPVNFK